MWLDVQVLSGRRSIFRSGAWDTVFGTLVGIENELGLPHVDRIDRPGQVAVYEMLAADSGGAITTSLLDMTEIVKDNRLLPKGWRADGPDADWTKPVGTEEDDDFTDGRDTVTYAVELPDSQQPLLVIARLLYQSIPPAWALALESSATEEAETFLHMYHTRVPTPEILAVVTASVPR